MNIRSKFITTKTMLFSAALLLTSASCQKDCDALLIDLSGTWVGTGYICASGQNPSQIIGIVHNLQNGELVATKQTGDDCVLAGNITFSGNYSGKASEKEFSVSFVTGSPAAPNSETLAAEIEIINSNFFKDNEGIEFRRQ